MLLSGLLAHALRNLLCYRAQDYLPKGGITHKGLRILVAIIKKKPHRLAYRPVAPSSQTCLGWCQVDKTKQYLHIKKKPTI